MADNSILYQRICNFTHSGFDPTNDANVILILRNTFDVHLPQRSSLDKSLEAAASEHEIINLILRYRMKKSKYLSQNLSLPTDLI